MSGQNLDAALVRDLLAYDPLSGSLRWKERPEGSAQTLRSVRAFNSRFAGKEAFTSKNRKGYRRGIVLGESYLAHRIVWLHVYGRWPVEQIDHINGRPDDNRISNLRDVSQSCNQRNTKRRLDNISGQTGVARESRGSLWRSDISVDGRRNFLGYFKSKEAAIAARKAAEIEFGFHPNHGRAA